MGRYAESAKFAKKAIAAAPKRARYRMILGNAYFKVLRFEEARTAYRAAKRLGAAEADKALRRVEAKLGE
jgi:Flp pilus assembly protein TadD